MRVLAIVLSVVLFFEALYCFLVFTDIPRIKALRELYIETALSTMRHQWLATAFLPEYMVENVRMRDAYLMKLQGGKVSDSSDRPTILPTGSSGASDPSEQQPTEPSQPVSISEERFYEIFWELNRTSFEDYLDKHPDVLENGWENIYIDASGINDTGTEIYTAMGEQVLAIDAQNQILLVRVQGSKDGNGYLGVLAIAKDPAQLRCVASAGIGSYGQEVGTITANSGGVLGMTGGNAFDDPNGTGNGGVLMGYSMCEGVPYGSHSTQEGYKRLELSSNNKFYINDASATVPADTTDAVEFFPALILDGELLVAGFDYWNGVNPRAAIGQSESGEILMLVIEGRQLGRSIGTDIAECADILMRHKCYTAMNLDGGTSAVMWYRGKYITKCSNSAIPSRSLPHAWVYGNYA